MRLLLRKFWGWIARLFSPGFSACLRCGVPWTVTRGHDTPYADGRACFPLCRSCWARLTPQQRLPYYQKLFEEWGTPLDTNFADIERAVLGGK